MPSGSPQAQCRLRSDACTNRLDGRDTMNEDRNQDRTPKQQARQKHPDEWQEDLNPNFLAGQNIGRESDARERADMTAFHLRKRGRELRGLDDNDLKQVPLVAEGTRLQQGATYVNLAE